MDGKTIHIQEEKVRENGEFLEALKLSDEATLLYQKEGNIVGLAEVQAARFEIFKHLFLQTNDRNFLILGKFAAKSGVKIAEKSEKPEALAIPLYCLAKALTLLGKHEKAQEKYQEALSALPNSPQNRPSVLADIKIHKAVCAYQMGNKEALLEAEEVLKTLEETDENKYEKDVWLSGGHMKLAEALAEKDSEKSSFHLDRAREIIEANPDLKLRKTQLDNLIQKLQ